MGPEARMVAARSGKSVSRRVAGSSVSGSGALVNPAAGVAVTRSTIEPLTRGQRFGSALFKAIGSSISGGLY